MPKIDAPRIRLAGYAAADEPRAVRIAQDLLAQGGSAADAGVGLALALTVTLPSRASLGGGGACLVRDGRDAGGQLFGGLTEDETPMPTQSVDFLPRPGTEGGRLGLPVMARGLYAIHAKYGTLRWQQIVAVAENMARFGVPASRALVNDIAAAHATITGAGGKPLAEGDVLTQPELAESMAALRTRGAGEMYVGQLAGRYVAGAGGEIDAAALARATADWQEAKAVPFGNDLAYFSVTPGGAFAEKLWRDVESEPQNGGLVARLLRGIGQENRDTRADVLHRTLAIADASAGMLPAPPPGLGEGDAATGFVVVDYRGAAMACSLTMGRLFGAGRIIGDTGIRASLAVPGPTSNGLSGAALLVTNDNIRKVLAAFAAGGDGSGAQVMVQTALNALASPLSLDDAMQTPRIYAAGGGSLLAEPGMPLGRNVTETSRLGTVNAVACSSGLPAEDPQCAVQADPRRPGLTATAERKR